MDDKQNFKESENIAEDMGPTFFYYSKKDSFNSASASRILKETHLSSLSAGLQPESKLADEAPFNGAIFFSSLHEDESESIVRSEQDILESQINKLYLSHSEGCSSVYGGIDPLNSSSGSVPSRFSPLLLYTPVINSTQEWLKTHSVKIMDEHDVQTVVLVAEQQTSGKGRGGNVWTSPAGCLMFSIARTVRLPSLDRAPFLNYVTCLAVAQGVRLALPPELRDVDLGLRIKWPNDIYLRGVKVGGILLNTSWRPGGALHVVTGIGLNVHNHRPTVCLEDAVAQALRDDSVSTSKAAESEESVESAEAATVRFLRRDVILAKVVGRLDALLEEFEREGFSSMEEEYLRLWMHSGQELMFEDDSSSSPSSPSPVNIASSSEAGTTRRVSLVVQGLTPSGFLLATNPESGERFELTPDGNSLNMMQGLIRRKLPY